MRKSEPKISTPEDVLGWRELRWGMTDEEIIGSIDISKLKRLPKPIRRYEGTRKEVKDEYYYYELFPLEIGNALFKAIFMMKEVDGIPRLTEVILTNEITYSDRLTMSDVKLIRTIISERYGRPVRDGSSDRFLWKFPTTTITIDYFLPDTVKIWFSPTKEHTPSSSAI